MQIVDDQDFRAASVNKRTLNRTAANDRFEPKAAGSKSRPSLLQQTERLGYALHRS
ncbi:hypothetical protein [Tateyamaria sp.]|uniref:hypothetical protein n=1 Tax=Tateyamaria sp. TaxID=1929288 RepID=UPI00329D55CD